MAYVPSKKCPDLEKIKTVQAAIDVLCERKGIPENLTISSLKLKCDEVPEEKWPELMCELGDIRFLAVESSSEVSGDLPERMRISADGKVGIGGIKPQNKLEVAKDISDIGDDGQIVASGLSNRNKGVALGFDTVKNVGFIYAREKGGSSRNLVLGYPGGKIGIGKWEIQKTLDVNGDTRANRFFIGDKWMLSGVGDRHGNDEWLRLFNANETDYYGGLAVGKSWVVSDAYFASGKGKWGADGTLEVNGSIKANRYGGLNSLILSDYQTPNPSSNVYLYSSPGDRDSWIFLDSASTTSNWGIYHRQINSTIRNLPPNAIGFIGNSELKSYISLETGNAYFKGYVGIGKTDPQAALHIGTGSIKFPDGSTQSTAPTPYVLTWDGDVPKDSDNVVLSKTITGPAVVLVMWKALAFNSAASGATYSRLFLDAAQIDEYGGLRNPSNAVIYWFDQTNSWVGSIPAGSHVISVREYADNGNGKVNNGHLSIMVWGK